jgi:hypothetical protein
MGALGQQPTDSDHSYFLHTVLAMFLLGFVADPIINLYLDPYTTLSSAPLSKIGIEPILTDDDEASWTEHFLKGLASRAAELHQGFARSLSGNGGICVALALWLGGRAGGSGRERLASISWLVVLIGSVRSYG